jgi:hypothetical protein
MPTGHTYNTDVKGATIICLDYKKKQEMEDLNSYAPMHLLLSALRELRIGKLYAEMRYI